VDNPQRPDANAPERETPVIELHTKAVVGRPFLPGVDARRNTTTPGPGRTPNKVRARSRKAMARSKMFTVLARIISGDIREQIDTAEDGTPIVGQTLNKDRIAAAKLLLAYGEGLPIQRILMAGGGADRPRVVTYLPDNGRGVPQADGTTGE